MSERRGLGTPADAAFVARMERRGMRGSPDSLPAMGLPATTRRRRGATVRRRSSDRGSIFEIDLTHERAWEDYMPDSVYKVIELVGTSTKSWEDAAKNAVDRAAKSLRDLRVAEVVTLDMVLDNGKVEAYRAKINVSFKYEGGG